MSSRGLLHRSRIVTLAPACALLILSVTLLAERLTAHAPTLPSELATLRIDVNTADEAQLRLLPEIGPAMAARILDDRLQNGPFQSLDDLKRVRGVGERTILNIKPFVHVSAPAANSGVN